MYFRGANSAIVVYDITIAVRLAARTQQAFSAFATHTHDGAATLISIDGSLAR